MALDDATFVNSEYSKAVARERGALARKRAFIVVALRDGGGILIYYVREWLIWIWFRSSTIRCDGGEDGLG
jgi:hypothetical protein